jgi:hypothetical protein
VVAEDKVVVRPGKESRALELTGGIVVESVRTLYIKRSEASKQKLHLHLLVKVKWTSIVRTITVGINLLLKYVLIKFPNQE